MSERSGPSASNLMLIVLVALALAVLSTKTRSWLENIFTRLGTLEQRCGEVKR